MSRSAHSLALFEVAHFDVSVCEACKSDGVYPNPKRQRGISGNGAKDAKTQSLTYVSGWDRHKSATSKLALRACRELKPLAAIETGTGFRHRFRQVS